MSPPAAKICSRCGRSYAWRPGWARSWEARTVCSAACRKKRLGARDAALEEAMLALAAQRGAGKTFCPSEAARRVAGEAGLLPAAMEQARCAARRLVARGQLQILQGGRVVDPDRARGPIRLRGVRPPQVPR